MTLQAKIPEDFVYQSTMVKPALQSHIKIFDLVRNLPLISNKVPKLFSVVCSWIILFHLQTYYCKKKGVGINSYFLRLRETLNALQLPVFFFLSFFSFFCQPYPGLWHSKSVFLILKNRNMADWRGEFNFFQDIHVRIGIRIDISISKRPTITRFGKQVHLHDLTQMGLNKQVLVTSLRQDNVTN